jgi:hypothetical protein
VSFRDGCWGGRTQARMVAKAENARHYERLQRRKGEALLPGTKRSGKRVLLRAGMTTKSTAYVRMQNPLKRRTKRGRSGPV